MDAKEVEFIKSHGIEPLDIIAHGGYGAVYLAFVPQYNRKFVLKKIDEEHFHQEEVVILGMVDNPRIVRMYKYFTYEKYHYMVMEYCPFDLMRYLETLGKPKKEVLFQIVQDIVLSIKACHEKKIAHCDIKPANFLVDSYGRVKISDFGLASHYLKDAECSTFKGTRAYMAPEIFTDNFYDPLVSDIWSLGVTLYYISTNRLPFYSKDSQMLAKKIRKGNYVDTIVEDANLRNLIACCLIVDPQERATIDELLSMPYFTENAKSKCAVPPASKRPMHSLALTRSFRQKRYSYGPNSIVYPSFALHLDSMEHNDELAASAVFHL